MAPSYKRLGNPLFGECTRWLGRRISYAKKCRQVAPGSFLRQRKMLFSVFLHPSRADRAWKKREGITVQFFSRANARATEFFFEGAVFFLSSTLEERSRGRNKSIVRFLTLRSATVSTIFATETSSLRKMAMLGWIEQVNSKMVYPWHRNVSPSWYAVQM